MRNIIGLTTVVCLLIVHCCSPNKGLDVTSESFKHDANMPMKFSCEGDNTSPALSINNIPEDAKSLAIIMHDPDAPMDGGFTHWVVWNVDIRNDIPADFQGAKQGLNTSGKMGYVGMCPPSGTHHYHFNVYALDTKLDLPANTEKSALESAMKDHIITQGTLTGLYKKQNL